MRVESLQRYRAALGHLRTWGLPRSQIPFPPFFASASAPYLSRSSSVHSHLNSLNFAHRFWWDSNGAVEPVDLGSAGVVDRGWNRLSTLTRKGLLPHHRRTKGLPGFKGPVLWWMSLLACKGFGKVWERNGAGVSKGGGASSVVNGLTLGVAVSARRKTLRPEISSERTKRTIEAGDDTTWYSALYRELDLRSRRITQYGSVA